MWISETYIYTLCACSRLFKGWTPNTGQVGPPAMTSGHGSLAIYWTTQYVISILGQIGDTEQFQALIDEGGPFVTGF